MRTERLGPILACLVGIFATAPAWSEDISIYSAKSADALPFATYRSGEGWLLDLSGDRSELSGFLFKDPKDPSSRRYRVQGNNNLDGRLTLTFFDDIGVQQTATYLRAPNNTVRTQDGIRIYSNWNLQSASGAPAEVPSELTSIVAGYKTNEIESLPSLPAFTYASIAHAETLSRSIVPYFSETNSLFGKNSYPTTVFDKDEDNYVVYTDRATAAAVEAVLGTGDAFVYTIGKTGAVVQIPKERLQDVVAVAELHPVKGADDYVTRQMSERRKTFDAPRPNFLSDYAETGEDPEIKLTAIFSKIEFARCKYVPKKAVDTIAVVCDYHSTDIDLSGQYWFRTMALVWSAPKRGSSDQVSITAEVLQTSKAKYKTEGYDKAISDIAAGRGEGGEDIASKFFLPVFAAAVEEEAFQ
jgi:hypothetical protein